MEENLYQTVEWIHLKTLFFISLIMPNLFERNRRIISNNCGNKFGPLSRQSLGHGPFRLDEASYTILVLVELSLSL